MRTRLVPVVNLTSSAAPFLIILGLMQPMLTGMFWLGIILYSGSVLFQLITLPVELNASGRALYQLEQTGALTAEELPAARKVLTAAALTYLGAALVSVLWLLRYIGMGRRR
jgi:Zn-dependent membrane protease YugP